MDRPIQTNVGTVESRADYLWNFFIRHKTGYADWVNRPFIINTDGKDYLAIFADHVMTRTLFRTKLYSSGLKIEQTRVRGVNTLEDGSLGEAINPDGI
jgi:hypothetical protein